MEAIVQFWLDMKVLFNLIASAILILIWKYLRNKPLGMQTLFDSMIKDYILIVFANFISSNLIFIKFKDEYSHETAMTLIKIQTCVAVAMFLQIFIALIIRYMSIFHQGYLNDFKDSVIVFISRIFVGISAVVISILEDSGEGGAQYVFLTGKAFDPVKAPKLVIFKAILLANFVLVIFVQVRIELLNRRLNSQLPYLSSSQKKSRKFLKNKFRYSAIVGGIFLLICLDYVISLGSGIDDSLKTLRIRVISGVLQNIVLPTIWIRKSKRFFNFFANYVLSFNCDLPIDPPTEVIGNVLRNSFKKFLNIVPKQNISPIGNDLVKLGLQVASISVPVVHFQSESQNIAMIKFALEDEVAPPDSQIQFCPEPGPSTSVITKSSRQNTCSLSAIEC